MALPDTAKVTEELPAKLRIAFAPLKKIALGLAFGTVLGLGLLLFGLAHMHPALEQQDKWLGLLEFNLYSGYEATVTGSLIGLAYGFATGFVMGWLLAGARNFSIALWVAIAGAKEQLRMDQEFLDEI